MKRTALAAGLALIGASAMAAAPGDMQPGKWVQINQTSGTGRTVASVAHSPAPGGNFDSIMYAWSGGAFATTLGSRGSLLIHGGGHSDYQGNEIYAFDVATGLWSKLYSPGSSCTLSTSFGGSPANSPCASHTYDTLEFSPVTNEFIKVGSTSDGPSVTGTNRVRAYNVLTGAWRLLGQVSGQSASPDDDFESSFTAWDSNRNLVWWHGGWRANGGSNLAKINPVTNAITTYSGIQSIDQYAQMAYDPSRQILVIIEAAHDELHVIDVTTGTPVIYTNRTMSGPALPQAAGFDYDPIADKFVVYDGGTTIYTITPPATWASNKSASWTMANASATGASPGASAENGTFGRFRYAPALCAFVVTNSTTGGVYAYQTATGGCGGAPSDPAPAVTLTATPASINTGSSSTLTWLTSNTSSCTASGGWTGSKTASGGTQSVSPTATASYTLTCFGVGTQISTQAASTATVTVQTGGGGTTDFATRCAAAGVTVCEDFDQASDFTDGRAGNNSSGGAVPVRDTSVKSSGASSARWDILSNSGAGDAGYFWTPVPKQPLSSTTDTSKPGFGPGDTLYWQIRMRMDGEFVNGTWGGSSPKNWILHKFGQSCTDLQLVQLDEYARTFPIMYHSCTGGENQLKIDLATSPINFTHQNGNAQEGDIWCTYRDIRDGPDFSRCRRYVPNEWMTYSYKMTFGAWNSSNNRVEAWAWTDSEPKIKWLDISNVYLPAENPGSDRFVRLEIGPYATSKDTSVSHPTKRFWVDDLIISTQPIADPAGGSATPAPTVNIAATPATVTSGGSSQIDWNTSNATSCTGSGSWSGSIPTAGSQSITNITDARSYTLSCTGSGGTTQATAQIAVTAAPPAVTFTASSPVNAGSGSTLTWSSTGATSCTATGGPTGWAGAKAVAGTVLSAALFANTTFGLNCTGAGGTTTADDVVVTVVTTPPAITITAAQSPLLYGGSTTIDWSVTNATACGWAQGFTPGSSAPLSGSRSTGQLTAATTYELACSNPGAQTARSVTVGVLPAPNPVITGFVASPDAIQSGEITALFWGSANTTACSIDNGIGSVNLVELSGENTGALTETTVFTLTCDGAGGTVASKTATVTVLPPTVPVVSLTATPSEVASGSPSTLEWSSEYASTCTGYGGALWGAGTGITASSTPDTASTGNLTANTAYAVECTSATGEQTIKNVNVTVTEAAPGPVVAIAASPNPIASGATSVLYWSSQNATSCEASGGWTGSRATESLGGETTAALTIDTAYTLTCTGPGGTQASTTTVSVVQDPDPVPVVTLSINPGQITPGGSALLTWSSTDATTCEAYGAWSGTKATSGNESTGPISATTSFQLTCSGPGGADGEAVALTVGTVTGAPNATITADRLTIESGGTTNVRWTCINGTTAIASDGAGEWGGPVALGGVRNTGALTATTDYTVTCGNGVDPDDSDTVTITVNPPLVVDLTAVASSVSYNGSTTLNWTTSGGIDACYWVEGFNGPAPVTGSRSTGSLKTNKRFTLSCAISTNYMNFVSDSVEVKINPGTIPRARRPRCRLWWCR